MPSTRVKRSARRQRRERRQRRQRRKRRQRLTEPVEPEPEVDEWINFLNEQERQSRLYRQYLLIQEIYNKNENAVIKYLEDGLNPNFTTFDDYDNKPRTPLMIAAQIDEEYSYYIIRELLDHKADPNYSDDSGSVLHWVIYQNPHIIRGIPHASESLEVLLERGANPFIRNEYGETAYDVCLNYRMADTNIFNELLLKEFMDIIRIQRNCRRKMTRWRVKTIKSERRLALMKCMESREGVLGTIRYNPTLLEHISKFM